MPYGARRDQQLELSEPGYWVRLRPPSATVVYDLQARMAEDSTLGTKIREVLLAVIVAWNLDDEQGQPLPINAETVDLLLGEDQDQIIHWLGERTPFTFMTTAEMRELVVTKTAERRQELAGNGPAAFPDGDTVSTAARSGLADQSTPGAGAAGDASAVDPSGDAVGAGTLPAL